MLWPPGSPRRIAKDAAAAIHCVTRVGLVVAIAAWREAGVVAGDRIEHGAVVPPELVHELETAEITVVTQPNLVAERGDEYLADVDADDVPHLWPCASLRRAGVKVAGGTDAPYGHPDPWRAIRAAVDRRTPAGIVLGPDERCAWHDAFDLFAGGPADPTVARRVTVGSRTDLCVLSVPLATAAGWTGCPICPRDHRPGGPDHGHLTAMASVRESRWRRRR